jgi:hypothetical protein
MNFGFPLKTIMPSNTKHNYQLSSIRELNSAATQPDQPISAHACIIE